MRWCEIERLESRDYSWNRVLAWLADFFAERASIKGWFKKDRELTYFLSIRAIQSPFEIPHDENDRTVYSCNYLAQCNSTDDLENDIISLLQSQSIVTEMDLCFDGMDEAFPIPTSDTDGPFLRVISTSGLGPNLFRGTGSKNNPSFQVITASTDKLLAKSLAFSVYEFLKSADSVTV